MIGLAQFGIAVSALGGVLMLMGLFPGVTGITPGDGIGIVQFVAIISGATLLDFGALVYLKYTLFAEQTANLAQQVAVRFSLTGLVLAGFIGLADYLGFGSHSDAPAPFFGQLQAGIMLVLLILAALGVLAYAVAGPAAPGAASQPNEAAPAEPPA